MSGRTGSELPMVIPNGPPSPHHDAGTTDRFGLPGGFEPIIWHVASSPAAHGDLSPEIASKLLDAYSEPGDLAVDVDEHAAFAAAATVAGRHYDSLAGDTRLAALSQRAGTADLVMMRWPRLHTNPRWLLVACRSLLRTDGRMAIAVTVPIHQRTPHISALIGAAHTAGMEHVAHVVILASTPEVPAPDREPHPGHASGHAPTAPASANVRRDAPRHDLLIFMKSD